MKLPPKKQVQPTDETKQTAKRRFPWWQITLPLCVVVISGIGYFTAVNMTNGQFHTYIEVTPKGLKLQTDVDKRQNRPNQNKLLNKRTTVNFTDGSVALKGQNKETLNHLAEIIQQFEPQQPIVVQVTGHASRYGSEEFNLRLSQERANVVRDYLKSRGVTYHINAEGKGSSQLIPGIRPDNARHQRAEICFVLLQ